MKSIIYCASIVGVGTLFVLAVVFASFFARMSNWEESRSGGIGQPTFSPALQATASPSSQEDQSALYIGVSAPGGQIYVSIHDPEYRFTSIPIKRLNLISKLAYFIERLASKITGTHQTETYQQVSIERPLHGTYIVEVASPKNLSYELLIGGLAADGSQQEGKAIRKEIVANSVTRFSVVFDATPGNQLQVTEIGTFFSLNWSYKRSKRFPF